MDWFVLCGIEAAVVHENTYPSRKEQYGPGLAGLLELGRAQSGTDYQKLILRRLDFCGRLKSLFEDIDLSLYNIPEPTEQVENSIAVFVLT